MFKDILGSLLRHAVTSAGGAIVAQGVITSDQFTQAVGALTTLAGIAASLYQKFKASRGKKSATKLKYNG